MYLCVYLLIHLWLCLLFSTDLPNLGKTGEEKQSFVGQSPKVTFKTRAKKADIQVRCFLPCRLCPCPPPPPACGPVARSLHPLIPAPRLTSLLPWWKTSPCKLGFSRLGPPAYLPSSPVGAWISKPPARGPGDHLTPSKGAARRRAQAAWVHMKGQHTVSCSQTGGAVGVSVGWGGGLGGSAVHSGFRFLHL